MTDYSREAYVAEVKALFNDICLVADTNLVRLIGFHEDEMDFYYHVKYMSCNRPAYITSPNQLEHYSSFVGPCVSLKGIYPRYEQLETIFTLNGCPPVDSFRDTTATAEENREMRARWNAHLEDWDKDATE